MGFRRRTRRRALVAGAAVAHHRDRMYAEEQPQQDYDQAPAPDSQDQAQYAPPPADPADELEHLAQLHASGALTDEEFADAKAKAIGS
jgi:Short C-terminal domain